MFDVYYRGNNKHVIENLPFAKPYSSIETSPPKTKMYWVIDEYVELLDIDRLNYRPEKYDQIYTHLWVNDPEMLGIELWPAKEPAGTKHVKSEIKIEYPVHYVSGINEITETTEDAWYIDCDYVLSEKTIDWTPGYYDCRAIHTFHIKNQLEHKYPEKMGGIRWVPKLWNGEYVIHDNLDIKYPYPIHYTDDVDDYSQLNNRAGWLVDQDYVIETEFFWIPPVFERNMIHSFKINSQLTHRYPEEMGGIRWVPENYQEAELKIHINELPFQEHRFDIFSSIEEGLEKATSSWFWVVDPNVTVLDTFAFDYVPEVWDNGIPHMWQKINPITGTQYDYSGVMLYPKTTIQKKRPKYIREPACKENLYPVIYPKPETYMEDIVAFDKTTEAKMYYVVDPYYEADPEFKFSYYPTQWDIDNVHVFLTDNEDIARIRLFPKGTFSTEYTRDDVMFNSFSNLKEVAIIAARAKVWPTEIITDYTREELISILDKHSDSMFVYTIDNDVDALDLPNYLPEYHECNNIHIWQRMKSDNSGVHSYGGLRLWPTNIDRDTITTAMVKYSRTKNTKYIREPGSIYKPYDIVYISYHEPHAESRYERLCERYANVHWVKDVEGIFNAHKKGASMVNTKMFWVVDADADVVEDFDFNYIPDQYDQDVVHVWNSKNPITGMEYGYGGVKLFNTEQVLAADSWGLDFTTGLSQRFKAIPVLSCITQFNTDAFSTWRSAFRECVKLSLKDDAESRERLQGWLHPVPDAEFRHDAKRGAEEGVSFAGEYRENIRELARINDYQWLREKYEGKD